MWLFYLVLIPLLTKGHALLNLTASHVWGPGLTPDKITLPARYFYVHLVDNSLTRLTASPEYSIVATVDGKSENDFPCHIWTQVLNRYDGSFIVRYKIFRTCWDATITVMYQGQHVGLSPYKVNGPSYPDDCMCPEKNLETWMENMKCPKSYDQITSDLKHFPHVDMNSTLATALERFHHAGSHSLCNYVVKDNKVYRKCYGKYVGFNMFMDAVLLSLARKVHLPDLELLVNLGDWPLVRLDSSPLLPIFSWCGSEDTSDIVMPTYDITESSLECMGRVTLDMLSLQGSNSKPWSEKINKGFWRGRDSCHARLKMIDTARENPDHFNASMTNFFFFKNLEEKYGPKEKHISFFDFFDYKYQINIDGTVAAYRFPYLLAGNSVVLKQDSEYYEHFYKQLKPWVHYIPFKNDLSDLVLKIQWAKSHDVETQKIGEAGRQFARNNLMPTDILCYHAVLLNDWSRRVKHDIEVRDDMDHVPQPQRDQRTGDCHCRRLRTSTKDEL